MGSFARVLPAVTAASILFLSGCGYLDDGDNSAADVATKSVTVSGTVKDGTGDGSGIEKGAAIAVQAKPKAVPAGGCPAESFTVRVGTEETCSIPLGGGIHEYEITSDVNDAAKTVVVNFRRNGFPPSSQSISLSGTGETTAPTFQPRVYDASETVDETVTFTVEADNGADDDSEPDAIVEIQADTTAENITVNILVVDPGDSDDRELLPSEQINADEQELEQFTAVEITLSDDDGEEVQPADDKPITVTLNLPPAAANGIRQLIAGGATAEGLQVGWRSYNEDKEVWEDEDADPNTAGRQGARVIFEDDEPVSVRALISHLTWYAAGDVIQPSEQGCLAVSVDDNAGNPIDDVVIKLSGEGEAFGDKAITDGSGTAHLDSLISTETNPRTVTISVIRDGSTVARLTGQSAPTTGGVSAEQTADCDLGPEITLNVEGTVSGTVVRGFQRSPAANASVFIESTDEGVDGLARTRTDASGAFTFTVPTPFNFEVFAGGDSNTGTLAAAAVNADAGELYLGNAAPAEALIDAAAAITVPSGSISLTGSGSDVDGDSLSFSWSATQGSLSSPTGENVSWTAPSSPSGSAVITLTISDGELEATSSVTLSWDEVNVAPTIDEISSSNAGNVPNGGTATITAVASDANSEDTITYSWSTSVGSIETGSESVEFTAPATGFGSATITLEISDGEFTASDTFGQGFGTPPNQAPVISSTSRSPEGNVTRSAAVAVSVSATDPDSSPSPLTIAWTANGGSFNGPQNAATAEWIAPNAIGSFEIVVTVSDGEDTATDTLVVVVANKAPVITSATSSPSGTVAKSATVALSSVASDPDGDDITYAWSTDVGSFNGAQDQETAEWVAPDTGGSATITLTVSDGLLSDSETISLTISSNGPVINSLTATPSGDVQRGTTVAFSSDVTDPDGDSITYEWTSNIGSFSGSITDPAASWVAPDASGNAVITLTVTDGEFTATDTLSFAVLNHEPVINSATADPSGTVDKSAVVSLSSSVTDNDGDATLEWTATGGTFNSVVNAATAEWQAPAEPGVFTITLTVSDGEFTSSADIVITVANAAPVIESITQDPSGNVSKGSAVTFESEVFDDNGDAITYSWSADGGTFSTATNLATVSWNAPTTPGSYEVTLVVSDGTDSDTETVAVTVVNATPIANDDIATTDVDQPVTVSVLANDSDADDDTLSIDAITVAPANGVAVIDGDQVVYTPDSEVAGTDSFTYRISDGFETATAVVTITIVEPQLAAFGDFNALSWGVGLESDSRFGNNKRLGYFSTLYDVSLIDQGNGDVDFTVGSSAVEYYMELNTSDGSSSIDADSEDEDFGGQFPANTDKGALYLHIPFYDDNEPGYAEYELPRTIRMLPAGDNNYIGAENFEQLSSVKPVVSEHGNGLNSNVILDEDFEPGLQFFSRRSESFDIATLTGDYGIITQQLNIQENGDIGVQGHLAIVDMLDGVGSTDSLLVSSISRENGDVNNESTFGFQEVLGVGESISYSLAPPAGDLTGRVEGTIQEVQSGGVGPDYDLDGYVDPDGKVFTLVSPVFDNDFADLSLLRAVRLGSGVVEADLIGKTYHLSLLNIGMSEGSENFEIEVGSSFRARFNSDGTLTYLCGSESTTFAASRDSDSDNSEGESGTDAIDAGGICTSGDDDTAIEDRKPVTGTWTLDNDRGQLTLTQTDTTVEELGFEFEIRGFVSEDLQQVVFSEYEEPIGDNDLYSSGIVIGSLVSEARFDNLPPEISVNTGIVAPILLSHGESIELIASTTDSDGDAVTVEWFAAGVGSFSDETGDISTFTAPTHGHGVSLIFATARDGKTATTIALNVEFGPGYADGATAEEHSAAAEDIDDSLLEPDDVTGFLAGFTPWTEVGSCLPFDSNGDTIETTGTQTRTHVDSGGADTTGQDLQVGDVIELIYDDCLEDDEFDDAYSDGTITITITQVSSTSGDGVHTFAWTADWDYEGRDIEDSGEEIDLITGQYTVTQSTEVDDGEDDYRVTRIEMLTGQQLRFEYTAPAGDSYNYGLSEGVAYVGEGTVMELSESDSEWELSFTFNYSEFTLDESSQRIGLVSVTVAPLNGRIENGGLTENVDYEDPNAGIVRNEFSVHPVESFSGTRVVVLDVQFNDPNEFSSEPTDMLIYVIQDWDGSSNDYELVAQTSYQILDDYESAPAGEAYQLLPVTFDGQKYRLVEIGRGFEITADRVTITAEVEVANLGIGPGAAPSSAEVHFGEGLDHYLNLDSHDSFSTYEESGDYLDDDKETLSVEEDNILASFESEFSLGDVCSVENETLATADGGGVYVSVYRSLCQGYGEVFIDGDGSPDGFNASNATYKSSETELILWMKGEESATNADLAGDYGLVTFLTTLGTGGSEYHNNGTMLKVISLDANGDYSETSTVSGNLFFIDRDVDGSGFVVGVEEPVFAGVTELNLETEPDGDIIGSFEFENGDAGNFDGAVSLSSGIIAVAGLFDGEGTDRGLLEHVMVKRSATPVLNNTQWLVQGISSSYDYATADNAWLASGHYSDDVATIVIDGSGGVTWSGTEYESRIDISSPNGNVIIDSNDEAAFSAIGSVDANPAAGDVALVFSDAESDFALEGFQSEDGNLMVMRVKGQDNGVAAEGYAFTGLYVLVRNDSGNVPNAAPSRGEINDPGIVPPGTTAALSIVNVIDPEAEPISYTWYASLGSFSSGSATSVEQDGVQIFRDAGASVTWHAPSSANPGESALIRVEATDGERFSATDTILNMN